MKKEIEAFVNAANEQELEAAWNNLSAAPVPARKVRISDRNFPDTAGTSADTPQIRRVCVSVPHSAASCPLRTGA